MLASYLCITNQETYGNIELLFKLININNIPFKFVLDFKIILLVNGQQTATSAYPSPYCFVTLRSLRGCDKAENYDDNLDNLNDTPIGDIKTSDECLRLQTYGDLR